MQDYFYSLARSACALARDGEVLLLGAHGEDSDFVRFNRGRVRQAGQVRQLELQIGLVVAGRQAEARLELAENLEFDLARVVSLVQRLRDYCALLPPDPYLNYNAVPASGDSIEAAELPDAGELATGIAAGAGGLDLVGILALGGQYRGFANSLGQRNWHARHSYNFDFSCYAGEDRAIKSTLAGKHWDAPAWAARQSALHEQLALLGKPRRPVAPGAYRVYLAPAALAELLDLLAWGGFGLKALRTAETPLLRLAGGEVSLHPQVSLSEDLGQGFAARFSGTGFALPGQVELVTGGRYVGSLAGERSAREYGVAVNAAQEAPTALTMDGGSLDVDAILTDLDTGLYINNLWYCNFSDRNQCRITGMTRFASFWVEQGRLLAPAEVMRFDDSLYSLLGESLAGLTRATELLAEPATYGARSLRSTRLPGALIANMQFPL